MPNAIIRESGLGLPSSVTAVDVVPEVGDVAPVVQVSDIGSEPDGRNRFAERATDNRLRRSIAARAIAPAASVSGTASTSGAASDELERQEIDSALREWVDLDKATRYADSPSQLLRATANHDHRSIPPEFELRLDPSPLENERILDEAAVLYRQLRKGASSDTSANGAETPIPLAQLRAEFIAALRDDYAQRRALAALVSPSGKAGQKTPFFDGFAIRNAQHKTFDELAALPEISADLAFPALTMDDKRRLLEKKFTQMGESTSYVIGTPEHSLATALMRIQSYRGAPVSTRFESPKSLLKAFEVLEKEWTANRFYPYHPRLLFAAHLARTEGVELMSPDDLLLVYENRVSHAAVEQLQKGNDGPIKWIARHLSQHEANGVTWKAQDERARAQIILSLFAALREAADGSEPIAGFARALRDSGALSEKRLVGNSQKARLDALLTYGNERLYAVFGMPPQFDRREAAAAILRSHGLSQVVINESRHYVIGGDNPHISKSDYGDLVDEFLDRADWSGLVGSRMTLGRSLQIVPRDELQQAEERFNEGLGSDPWIIARAKENLWTKDARMTAKALSEEVERIAGDLKTETESHRALMRGVETWINMMPVAGPIYNIEEGIRHHDAARAAFGLLFLGLDLFDIGTGGGGRAGKSAHPHPVTVRMSRAAARLDASVVDVATHPMMVEAAADPVDIAVQDGDIPLVHRGFAQRVRNGEGQVRWRDYNIVHLEHENRVALVMNKDGIYYEVDWHSGHRVQTKSPLERDPLSDKLRPRDDGLAGGLGAGWETIRGSDVETRLTVDTVKGILKKADRAELRDFDRIFKTHFEYPSPGVDVSTFDAKGFYGRLYKSSRTFRRLANRFEDAEGSVRNGTREQWQFLAGEAGPLGSPTHAKAYTDFDHRRIYMPTDATIESMQYMTAGGLQALSPEQAYLHEMIHALTGARDPERALDMLNRGPVVYLTDKILSEGGYAFAEQVMYRRQNSLPDTPPHERIEYHRDAAANAAHAENRYLDPLVDGKRVRVSKDTLVEGIPVESRVTVRGAKDIVLDVAEGEDDVFLSMSTFDSKFSKHFGFFASERTPPEVVAADVKTVTQFYRRLYRKSETFRHLFERMPTIDAADSAATWRFMLDEKAPIDGIAQGASLQPAQPVANEIYVIGPGLQYLSSRGLRDVEFERKLTYDMVCAMGGFSRLAPADAYRNRGPAVYLTDAILQEAGFHYPKQLVAALAGAGDRAAQDGLAAYQTSAQRSAAIEDLYLSWT